MASLSGVSSSNTLSSLMNSANTITGLASGLDTESMIESLVKSYQTKINQLNQKVTKVEWKQDAYRSIISQMVGFANKYTSYTSSTNLMSASFFSNAVKVAAMGKYADAVSASGKTTSNISLNAVRQLATSAQYRTGSNLSAGDGKSIEASEGIDLDGTTVLSSLNGSLTLTYGSKNVTISFDRVADVKAMEEIRAKKLEAGESATDADVLMALINQKLEGQKISLTGGNSADATDRIQMTVEDGKIVFSDKSNAGNSVFISSASGNVAAVLGISDALKYAQDDMDKPTGFSIPYELTEEVDNKAYLSGETMNITLDGVTKSITLPTIVDGKIRDTDGNLVEYNAENYTKVLNDALQSAFKGKVEVENTANDGSLKLRFNIQDGSNLLINTDVGETLGIGQVATSYLNTSKTLGELMGDKLEGLTPNGKKDKYGDDLYDFVLNGVKVGSYSKNSTLAELMSDINASDAGVRVSYSQTTKKFLFESKETGVDSQVNLGGGLAKAMFGEDHGDMKVTGLLDISDINKDFSFSIDGNTFSGRFESNSETMDDLLKKLNDQLEDKGYKASYSVREGLVIKDSEGNVKTVEYADEDNNILKQITDASKQDVRNRASDTLSSIVGESVRGKNFSFTIDGKTYEGGIVSDTGTMKSLLNKLNNQIFADGEYKASYYEDRGLVITDRDGNEVDVEYGEDVLGAIVKAVEIKDYAKDKLTDVLGGDIVNVKEYEFTVNGKTYTGKIDSSNMTMDDMLASINGAMRDSGYTASYSPITGELVITDYKGNEAEVEYGADGVLDTVMGAYKNQFNAAKEDNTYTKGQDAIFDVTVNGEDFQMVRSSNSVDIDGLTITLKDTFDATVDEDGNPVEKIKDAVTFKSSTDSDKIVDAIKSMIADYNVMMAEIKSAYSTMPYRSSSGSFANYEPLTEEDMEGMSESAIERYEAKAKQGILFGDRNLSALYTKLNQAFSFNNTADVDTLKAMGITVNYSTSDGVQAVTLDESKLRALLDSDPDRVADLFTKSDGIMDRMQTQLDTYAKTTGEPKGILIQQAGSPLSPLSLMSNTWQSEIDNYTNQIEKWQTKLQAQVERYTSQFTRLEQLINQMNSQSSALAGLMSGS